MFSMLIGTSINLSIAFFRWLIWRDAKPHHLAFLILCVLAAPIGYYFGGAIGLAIYGYQVHAIFSISSYGNQFATILISLIAGFFFWNQTKIAELQAQQEKEKARSAAVERAAVQAQLQLLQAQIEPHMLFNTLANLQGLIAIDVDRAQHMLEQLIRYLRATLSSSRLEQTKLENEFELIHAYLELLTIRMGKRLRYQIDLPTELRQHSIPPMLLQPLVENAIKHGLEPKVEGGEIHVSANIEAPFLHIRISDTGLGLGAHYDENKTHPQHHSHVGNANIRERLNALYGDMARLHLEQNPEMGVTAHLYLPLAQNQMQ